MIKLFKNDLPNHLIINEDIAIDTETMGLNLYRDRLCLLQISDSKGNAYVIKFIDKDYNAPNLKKLLLNDSITKIFHFARFDLAMIKIHLNITLNNIFCTKIASKLVRTYSDHHGLKKLCYEFLNVNLSKQEQSSYWGGDEISDDQLKYAASDVLYLHQLRDILTKMLETESRYDIAKDYFSFLNKIVGLDILGFEASQIFEH